MKLEWSAGDAADMIARPRPDDDKYRRGVLGIETGSERYPGAAVLGVEAALATGVGMVRYLGSATPRNLVLQRCPEVVVDAGRVQATLIGSGMPAEGDAAPHERVLDILRDGLPAVLDAGALISLRDAPTVPGPVVITPHERELANLLDIDPAAVKADRAGCASRAAQRTGTVVLLKGSRTIVSTPAGEQLVCPAATPWLATAGTGDVLAGILGALLASNSAVLEADEERRMLARLAATASVLHALAAERASSGGPFTVRALLAAVPPTIAGLLA